MESDEPFVVFDQQDSGCLSYGVERDGRRLFVKTAQTPSACTSLRRAIAFHAAVRHPAIVAPEEVTDTLETTRIVYPWRDGTVLNHATVAGSNRSALERFRTLELGLVLAAIGTIIAAHEAVANAGFVSVDLYDGCFLYDFDRHELWLIDLDEYRPGPFVLDADRLPGSRRYMAPEEFERGATIDQRTMVFHLGQTIAELLDMEEGSRCSTPQRQLVEEATSEDPDRRPSTVAELAAAWRGVQRSGRTS